MKITVKIHRDEMLGKHFLPAYLLLKESASSWQSYSAGAALGGGFLCPVTGAVLDFLCSYTRLSADKPILNKISLILYLLTVPMLLLGAHFLDLLENKAADNGASEADSADQPPTQFALQAKIEDC